MATAKGAYLSVYDGVPDETVRGVPWRLVHEAVGQTVRLGARPPLGHMRSGQTLQAQTAYKPPIGPMSE